MSAVTAFVPTKSSLSPARRRLVELLQNINFGRLEKLTIQRGEPVFDPPPRISRVLKLGNGFNGPRPEYAKSDFLLKKPLADLFEQLGLLNDGVVESIEVLGGLPNKMIVAGLPAPR